MLVYKSVYLLITILVFRTSCVNGAEKSKIPKTVLNIGGIFPILGKGGWQGGQGKYRNSILTCTFEFIGIFNIVMDCVACAENVTIELLSLQRN